MQTVVSALLAQGDGNAAYTDGHGTNVFNAAGTFNIQQGAMNLLR